MADFNLTSFLSGGNDEPEQIQDSATAPVIQDAGSGNDFDLTKFISANPAPKQDAADPDYGVLDRQRDTVVAETGDEDLAKSRGNSLLANVIPGASNEIQKERDYRLKSLESLRDGSALADIKALSEAGKRGKEIERRNNDRRHTGILSALSDMGGAGGDEVLQGLALMKKGKEEEQRRNTETLDQSYFRQLDSIARNGGIDDKTIAKLRESSATVDEYANKLRGAAEGALTAFATRRKEAQERLAQNKPGAIAEIVNGLITNAGYQGQFLIASATGLMGYAHLVADSAERRAGELTTKSYDVDDKGNLIVIHNEDSAGNAMVKGLVGGATEVAVELALEKGLGLAFKGLKRIPGVGNAIGAIGDGVSRAAGKMLGAAGAKLSKSSAGKFIVGAAENFGKYSQHTGVHSLPMEMLEEHVQDFADSVLGFDTKGRDYTSFGNEAADWWHNKFWNAEHNKELFLGLVGTMAVQGAYAGTKAHHDIKKWRQNPAGFLKTVIDEKTVDRLSDKELAHLYNFVASPGFTKERVERFLGHVKDCTDMANALMELKEANTPFFDTDKKAVDEAITSGSLKSRFVPPTTDVSGGKSVDWQPFMWKDGTKTKRVFDQNTGIAIDKLDGNRLCVTNRDGMRIVVDGETSGEAFSRAMSTADKMDIHNQLLDAKRPAKEAYIKKRIAETAQNGRFALVKNAAELEKRFPHLKESADYTPDNPALTLSDGRIVLVTDNMKNAQEVNRMILHEAGIHVGLNKKFTTQEKRKFLKNVKDPAIERYKQNIDKRREARGLPPIDWNSDQYIEEAFAHVWDRRRTNPLLAQKVSHFIRDIGRAMHLPVSYNVSDLEVMVDTMQRDLRKPGGMLDESTFDTANATDSVPYNEAQRDFSGDVADIHSPAGTTEGGVMARNMQRNDRIAAAHPHLWEFAMRQSGGDEDAAADYVSERLEDEGRRGKSGEMDYAHHALLVAEKMETGDDLTPEDLKILDDHGFTGPILYRDYGYRKQKDGTWKLVGARENAAHPELAPKSEKPKVSAPVTAVPVTVNKSNRQQKAEHERKFVDSLKTKGGRIQRLPAASIKTGDGRIVQFKEDADPKTGIVPGNELEGEYDERTAGLPVVMHFEDGHYETVTGRHRVNLAQRQGIDINVLVLEHGEDGRPGTVSIAEAEAIDAKANIKDGKGSMKDYIKFFSHAKMTRAEAEKEGLLGKKTQGRKAFALYHDATKELTASVDFDGTSENDERTITPEQAGIIAMNAPKDGHKLNGAVQRSMRDYCVAHPKANGDRLARLTQAKAHQLIQAEKNGQMKPNADGQMFLFEDMAADVAATDKLDEIENYKEKRAAEYRKLANRIRDAKNSKTVIGGKSMGSILQIAKEAAQELDLIDVDTGDVTTDRKRLEEAAQLALGKAFMWTRMELPEKLQDELERDLKLGKYAPQQDLPIQPDTGKAITVKPEPKKAEPKPEPKKTPQQIIDRFSSVTGIPVTMFGANGEVEADSTAAAEAAIRGESAPKADNGAVDLGDAADEFDALANEMWFSRELEEHTEEEKQAHNLMVGVKMVKLFASKGYKDFGQFARTFAARMPEAYRVARDYIPGMWLTARITGVNVDPVDENTALEVLKAVDGTLPAVSTPKTDEKRPSEPSERAESTNARSDEGTRGERISAAADELVAIIERGSAFSRQDLERIVGKHLGGSVAQGTFSMKQATDILELAVNRHMKNKGSIFSPSANVSADQAVSVINRIRQILSVIPTATTRSAEQDKMQQFSTVPHEAFVAAWVANVTKNDISLEPSAGIGGLAVFSNIAGADVILNELSKDRREILEQLGIAAKVYDFNAEDLWSMFYPIVSKGEVKRPTVVVMNPPFSNSQRTDRKDTIGIGGKHIEEALNMLAPGGRLVAIVGHGMAHDAESPKVRAWWRRIGEKYQVRADVTVNGNEYAKYGTTYDNNIIVIDKVAPNANKTPVYGKIESIDELPAMLEGVRNDRPEVTHKNAKSATVQQGGSGSVASNGQNSVSVSNVNTSAGRGERSGGTGSGGRSDAGSVRPESTSDGTGSKANSNGNVRGSGLAGGAKRGRADNGNNVGDTSEFVQSADSTVIDGSGTGAIDTEVREVGNGTFAEYRPSKVRVPGAKPHPTALVESTAMASVLPPNPTYQPILPKKAVESGQPSEAQIEQILYAGQAHEQFLANGQRRGYFIGDGTGLGKGTEISGVICDNYNHGRKKAVWVSKSSNLFTDAQRDLKTFGLETEVFEFDPKKKGNLSRSHGIAFMSYPGLSQDVAFDSDGNVLSKKKNKINRFQHLVNWLGKDFDGVIVFDECHKAGNAVATKGKRGQKKSSNAGRTVVALQNALPKARILYVSATGATEVSNLSYATRLGLWGDETAFRDREAFIEKVSSGGLSVMEIVARDMKSMGVYSARTLSYEGIVNRKIEHKLSEAQTRKYDEFADAWQLVVENVKQALVSTGGASNSQAVSAAMSAFWGGQQRFFNQVLTAMQMPSVLADAKKQLEAGNSVVFQLVNTNEATQEKAIRAQQAAGEEVNPEELDLSPRDILIGFVEHSFPTTKYVETTNADGDTEWVVLTDNDGKPVEDPIALEAKNELLDRLRMMKLDNNPLELLLEEFGVENVAEITGRSRRRQPVRNADGEIEIQLVRRTPRMREAEIDDFNSGKRRVLVFSDAGGTGKSFHADKRFANTSKRIHYLVQAGWRADGALQGFGRTHRSNEKQPPEYVLCSTDIRGHQRFISTVARRLAQLGSLTAGDRSSAGSGVFSEEDNLENKYASGAVRSLFADMFHEDFGRFNMVCRQLGFVKMKIDRRSGEMVEINTLLDDQNQVDPAKLPDVPTFLNRILNCRVAVQNQLFNEFAEKMRNDIEAAKDAGKYDPGLEKLQGDSIAEVNRTEIWNSGEGTGSTDIVEVDVGMRTKKTPFDTAMRLMMGRAEGRDYFFARNTNSGKIFGFAETNMTKTDERGFVHTVLRCFSPDGKAFNVLERDVRTDGERSNFDRLLDTEAEKVWTAAMDALPDITATKRYFIHGTMLPIWDRLGVTDPRIYRIMPTGGNTSFLGMEIKADSVNDVLRRFGKSPQSVELTPAMVLNRIIQEGKTVPLQRDEWELRRSKILGDFRVELVGLESVKEMQTLEAEGVGFIERISFKPRFFIPRTEEGVAAFLAKYPAIPEDGGIANAQDSGVNYITMTPQERIKAFSDKFAAYSAAFGRSGSSEALDELENVITAMSTQELIKQAQDFQQYDSHRQNDPVHHLRMSIKKELSRRGALKDSDIDSLELWYSRELEESEDELSAIAIHEVNIWRTARGLPEIVHKQKTTVDRIVRAGKYMASNKDEMDRFIKVSAETPHGWTAVETNAVQQRRIELERDFDEKTDLINRAEMDGNTEQAQKIREARNQVQEMIDTIDRANRFAAREWGLTGLARRFLLNRNGTFARFTGEIRSDIGRQLSPEEEEGARILWDAYRDAQGKLDEATVRKTSELLKDVLRKSFQREAERHKIGNSKTLKQIESEYSAAIDHLIVHANRSGGFLMNLPDGRKWVDAIRRYHMAAAIEVGEKPSVEDIISRIKADIESTGMIADRHDIMQIITGHGNTYEADNSELEKAMREHRTLMNEYQKWEDMMDEGHLPDKTGLIRDEPTQDVRAAQKITRDLMREFMAQHPELMQQDATRRLKTVQDSLMKRWANEIEDLEKAIESGEKLMRTKGIVQYTPEMEAKKRELEAKRKEYREMFPPEPLTHSQKLERYLRVLSRHLAELEAKRDAIENAKTPEERAALFGKRKKEKFEESEVQTLLDRISEVKEDIQDLHDMHFPAGTYEEFRAMVSRRLRALSKNMERIEAKLNARDFGATRKEPSEIAKRVANDPSIIEATRLRNAAAKRLMQERDRYKRSVLPYNAGRALDWFDALMAAPRVFRTMLDLSATMTQGAALFSSHPVMGYEALTNSIKAFASEANTDTIMAALMTDPDFQDFIDMGGHIYNVSNLDEKSLPEEFRGIAHKLVRFNGKAYGLDDIPGVKGSERSFGIFLNCINLSVYKALKANGGWGPTGPSESQKKDIARSLNVASGRGYENTGGHGAWDRIMSAALWAPRFAISGFKMATGWNVFAPHFHGDITERSYKDRMVSSKQAAKEYARQIASMAAWTLLATLLIGRKDPEWLEEVMNPLSSNFLNVRVGNTNLNFFGPIKQWWTFMSRFITGKTVGMDGMTRNRGRDQLAGRFVRSKLSPLAGLVTDLIEGKDYLGNKLVWDRSAEAREKNAWKHIVSSVGLPLSVSGVIEAFENDSLANALLLTPFIIAGVAKNTYQLDEYARVVSPYKHLVKEYKAAQKEGRWDDIKALRADNPVLGYVSVIDERLKRVALTKKEIGQIEKRGEKPSDSLLKRYELEQNQVAELIKKYK